MFDQLLEHTAERAPELVVFVVVVWMFLKHLNQQTKMFRELNAENVEARQHSREVIEKNTEAAAHNTVVMAEMTAVMREFLQNNPSKHRAT